MADARCDVAIIGAGPAGLFLSHLLGLSGISSIVVERQSQAHVEGRVRAGVLEAGSVDALTNAGLGERLGREGLPHDGFEIVFEGRHHRVDLMGLTGKPVTIYGQTEITHDLIQASETAGREIVWEAEDVRPGDVDTDTPYVAYRKEGTAKRINARFVAGCDGFHGVARHAIPASRLRTYERTYPFGWLGILAEVKPVSDELIYASHERGFALCSMRTPTRSRYYLQVGSDDHIDNWPDDRFWDELVMRIGPEAAANLETGPSFEKSIAPLRSFVAEPIRYGSLFLAGDAAHIVPPTGAKGLNLALADVQLLHQALERFFQKRDAAAVESYSDDCLRRVWKAERFSWWMTTFLHIIPGHMPFDRQLQRAEFDYLRSSEAANRSLAENYVGLALG